MVTTLTRPTFSVASTLVEIAAAAYDMDPWDLPRLGGQRLNFRPRFAVVWALRKLGENYGLHSNPYTQHRIARLLGFDDRTSVRYAFLRAEQLRKYDPKFKALTNMLVATARKTGPQVRKAA